MDARSPLHTLGGGFAAGRVRGQRPAAGMEFFNRTMGIPRFYVIEDFGL